MDRNNQTPVEEVFTAQCTGKRAIHLCDMMGITTIEELSQYSPRELRRYRNCGEGTIRYIQEVMKERGGLKRDIDWNFKGRTTPFRIVGKKSVKDYILRAMKKYPDKWFSKKWVLYYAAEQFEEMLLEDMPMVNHGYHRSSVYSDRDGYPYEDNELNRFARRVFSLTLAPTLIEELGREGKLKKEWDYQDHCFVWQYSGNKQASR